MYALFSYLEAKSMGLTALLSTTGVFQVDLTLPPSPASGAEVRSLKQKSQAPALSRDFASLSV